MLPCGPPAEREEILFLFGEDGLGEAPSLAEFGAALVREARRGKVERVWHELSLRDVLSAALMVLPMTLEELLAAAVVYLDAARCHSGQSRNRMIVEMGRFVARCEWEQTDALESVTPELARRFIEEAVSRPNGSREEPSATTQHTRRTAVRLLFRAARHLDQVRDMDPTLDLVLPPRGTAPTRPLTDEEIIIGRLFCTDQLLPGMLSRHAAAWALAEATATPQETCRVRLGDIDLPNSRVWLAGRHGRFPRWGTLTPWGAAQVHEWLTYRSLTDPNTPVIYDGDSDGIGGQVSSCQAVADVLRRAGLNRDKSVKPGSVAAWAGRTAFDATGRIEDAARALGVSKLDRAAELIGHSWRLSE